VDRPLVLINIKFHLTVEIEHARTFELRRHSFSAVMGPQASSPARVAKNQLFS
jgi:hypothetical protein